MIAPAITIAADNDNGLVCFVSMGTVYSIEDLSTKFYISFHIDGYGGDTPLINFAS